MAATSKDLEVFVREALLQGQSRAAITAALTGAGWAQEQVEDALAAYADTPFPIPVPRPRPYLSAREAFLYLVLFASLYVWTYHLGSLLFDLINGALPDPADSSDMRNRAGDSMRMSVASLLIAFPLFLFVARVLSRELLRNPVKRQSVVRRWLTYMTLFLAAGVLVGDMISLLYHLLGGELTLRFVLKVLVVGGLAGGVFGFYLQDLRREEREP